MRAIFGPLYLVLLEMVNPRDILDGYPIRAVEAAD